MKTVPVRVYTFSDFRADLIPYQYKALKAFLKEDFEFTVFNNTPDERREVRDEIERVCRSLGIRHLFVEEQNQRTVNEAHAQAIHWGWQSVIRREKSGFIILLDFDVFPLAPFSIETYMAGADIAGLPQSRNAGKKYARYFWPGFMILRGSIPNKRWADFRCGRVGDVPVDVGGRFHHYLRWHPFLKKRSMRCSGQISSRLGNMGAMPEWMRGGYEDAFNVWLVEEAFLHYGGASNWDGQTAEHHQRKTAYVFDVIDRAISGHERVFLEAANRS